MIRQLIEAPEHASVVEFDALLSGPTNSAGERYGERVIR